MEYVLTERVHFTPTAFVKAEREKTLYRIMMSFKANILHLFCHAHNLHY